MIFSDGCHRGRRMQSIPLCSGFLVLAAWLMMTGSGIAFDQPPSTGPVRELRVGALAHDVDGLWSGDAKEAGPDFCLEVLFNRRLFDLLSATAYPDAGASLNTRGDTSKIYGGFLLQWEPTLSAFFFSTGLGLSLHNGNLDTDSTDRKSLGSRVLFRIPIEIGYVVNPHHRIILAFDHVSNAGLASPNEGLDSLGRLWIPFLRACLRIPILKPVPDRATEKNNMDQCNQPMFDLFRKWKNRHFSDPQRVILGIMLLVGAGVVYFIGSLLAPVADQHHHCLSARRHGRPDSAFPPAPSGRGVDCLHGLYDRHDCHDPVAASPDRSSRSASWFSNCPEC
jgi:lipid A 3-O-deacylase